MKKFKIIKISKGVYIIKKRNIFFLYKMLQSSVVQGSGFYESEKECITFIHTLYYPDECDIEVIE